MKKKNKNLVPHTEIVNHKEGIIEYRLRTETFRQFLQVFVWTLKEEEHIKFFSELWIENPEYHLGWFYTNQVEWTNIIRLRKHSLNTLAHELTHFIGNICNVIWCDIQEEIPAYIMEEILSKLMILSNGKFKVEKRYFLEE